MLILTRKLNESITIGNNIKITVIQIGESHIKLGITAPKNIGVHRLEVYERIKEENERAVELGRIDLNEIGEMWKRQKGSK